MSREYSEIISIHHPLIPVILGSGDQHLRALKSAFNVNIAVMGDEFTIKGDKADVLKAVRLIDHLREMAMKGELTEAGVNDALRMMDDDQEIDVSGVLLDSVKVAGRTRNVSPKSPPPEGISAGHQRQGSRFRHWPCGNGENLSCHGYGCSPVSEK
ncbi:MAG: KH domain-containing protein [Geovibrio sp.]|nr:KH domain-containing protein [Geovibrio sp.]